MCLQWDNNLQTHLHTGLHTHACILTLKNYNSTVLEHEVGSALQNVRYTCQHMVQGTRKYAQITVGIRLESLVC